MLIWSYYINDGKVCFDYAVIIELIKYSNDSLLNWSIGSEED